MVEFQLLDAFMHQSLSLSLLFVAATVLAIPISWVFRRRNYPVKHKFPVIERPKDGNWNPVIAKAYKDYRDQPFELPLPGDPRVILPSKFLEEIKSAPETKLSFAADSHERMATRYTGVGSDFGHGKDVIKVELTHNISNIMSDLQDELAYAFDSEIGQCNEWTVVYIYAKLLQITTLLTGRTFVGLPLCRDRKWRDISINYTIDGFTTGQSISSWNPWLRPFVAPFLPGTRKLQGYERYVRSKMRILVKSFLETRQTTGKKDGREASNTTYNLAHWYIGRYRNPESVTLESVSRFQLDAGLAAIHTTTMTTTQALLDLAAYPEIVPELRAEIEGVIEHDKSADGFLQKSSMFKLRKLDSFIKESQRMNPLGPFTINRHVVAREGYTLSNGQHLPRGTRIAVALPFNPRILTDPKSSLANMPSSKPLNEFDAFRFSKLRSQPGEENKHQFVTTGPESLSFGHGLHACPGRFFASNEIKLILIEFIKRFDIGIGPQGQGASQGFDRPKSIDNGAMYIPDPRAQIYVKRRS